jgi:hypothetical protein
MLPRTRPIKVADSLPAEGSAPVQLNLLKAGLLPTSARNAAELAKAGQDKSPTTSHRQIELPRRKIDLRERVTPNGDVDLSDAPPAAERGGRPPIGLASVREVPEPKEAKKGLSPDVLPMNARRPEESATSAQSSVPPSGSSPALARVVEAWPHLSPCIQAAILAMVEVVAAGLDGH